MRSASILLFLAVVLGFAAPRTAQAGGLYLSDRGARALGRGGAFVAGADDGQSLWYNPAGIAYAGRKHFLLDGSLTFFRGSFTRVTRDDISQSPTVDVDPLLLPIPTLAAVDSFGLDDFSFGIGVMAPNAVTLRWPETATGQGGEALPPPTRHSLVSMEGSAIVHFPFAVAYSGIPGLSIGAGVHVILAKFHAGVYLSACDYGLLCQQPEQADYEAPAVISLDWTVRATPMVGLIYQWGPVRIGASALLFYDIKGTATLDAELPNAPLFGPSDECGSDEARETNPNCARIVGNKADLTLPMPLIARFGVEVRPIERLRLEVDVVYEGWSRQQRFSLNPHDIQIEGALGIPSYEIGPIDVPRNMQDVWSLRFGTELSSGTPVLPVTVRMGLSLEQGALPTTTLTPLTLDSRKAILTFGLSWAFTENVHADLMYAHVFMGDPKVRNSTVYPQNPLRPPLQPDPNDPVGMPEPVGNGDYSMEADILGAGLRINL